MTDKEGSSAEMLRVLQDRVDIADLVHRYGRGTDGHDLAMVLSVFSGDAFVEGSRISLPHEEYYRKLSANIAYYRRMMHYMSNQVIDVDGDRGSVETYCQALHWSPESLAANAPADLQLGVVYKDEVGRIDGRWLITHRKVHPQWRVGEYHPQWSNA